MTHCKMLWFLVLYKELALKTEMDLLSKNSLIEKTSESPYYLFSEITMQYCVPNFIDRQKDEN